MSKLARMQNKTPARFHSYNANEYEAIEVDQLLRENGITQMIYCTILATTCGWYGAVKPLRYPIFTQQLVP